MTFPSSGGGGGGRFGGGERQIISGQAALIHTDGWTWEDMAIDRDAAVHLIFPALGGRGGRGGGAPDAILEMIPGATGATGFTAAKRNYDQQVAKIAEFFDTARQYQKERAAKGPGFKPVLKMEAMMPVLEGKVPLAVSAARASVIHDAIAFAEKQRIKIVILQPRDIAKVGPELKAKNIPVILGKVLALPNQEDDPYDGAFTLPAEAYKAGVKFAFGTFENEFVRNLPYQAATAVAFGLPYEEALKAVTINAAQIWGHASDIGSVEKGKVADVIVTTGDPLEVSTQVKYVFIKGKEVPLVNKQTRLYEKYMSRQ
jgi:imidazolonepropionase-like amidohydrolase